MDRWANNVSLNTSHTRETVGKPCIFIFKGCRLGPHKYYTILITWLGYTCTHNNHYFFLQQLLVYKSWSMIIFLLIFTNFLDTSNYTTITKQIADLYIIILIVWKRFDLSVIISISIRLLLSCSSTPTTCQNTHIRPSKCSITESIEYGINSGIDIAKVIWKVPNHARYVFISVVFPQKCICNGQYTVRSPSNDEGE